MIRRILLLSLAFLASAATATVYGPATKIRHPLLAPFTIGLRRATNSLQATHAAPATTDDFTSVVENVRGGGSKSAPLACSGKPCAKLLQFAYTACGIATTAAWSTVVYTTIRSNQPVGAMMPSWQHGFYARIGAMAAAPLIISSFATLACSASKSTETWEELGSPTCRRHNLALATAGVGGVLWTGFAPIITKIPGTDLSHQAYKGAMRAGLIGCFGSAALLGGAVWARSLPDDVRRNPLSWPGRIADGVSQSLVNLAPANRDDPVNVKFALLTSSFLIFTGMGTLCNMPTSVIPSWTSRRLSRFFPLWTILAATTSYDLKEAVESGKFHAESKYRDLSNGLRGFGVVYLGARAGAIFLDPSFPEHFPAVNKVPGLAVAAIVMIAQTLRSDDE